MGRPDLTNAPWRTSTYSGSSGTSCVEVAPLAAHIAVRDSKNRTRGAFLVSRSSWALFVCSMRRS